MNYFLIGLLSILFICPLARAQYEKIEEYSTMGKRMEDAINVQGERSNDKVAFFAENRSNYPYVVEISFSVLENLEPYTFSHQEIVFPGKSKLIEFTQRDKEKGFNYQYQTKYYLGNYNKEADKTFPYLLPLKPGSEVVPYKRSANDKAYLLNHFSMAEGDAVYCMRKGYVVATPDMFRNGDRISKQRSVEIMHADGTVMVYDNIDMDNFNVKLGETIYPGQVIGVVNYAKFLRVRLCHFSGEGRVCSLSFLYVREDGKAERMGNNFLNSKAVHPHEICVKEFTRREKKRLKQGKIVL